MLINLIQLKWEGLSDLVRTERSMLRGSSDKVDDGREVCN